MVVTEYGSLVGNIGEWNWRVSDAPLVHFGFKVAASNPIPSEPSASFFFSFFFSLQIFIWNRNIRLKDMDASDRWEMWKVSTDPIYAPRGLAAVAEWCRRIAEMNLRAEAHRAASITHWKMVFLNPEIIIEYGSIHFVWPRCDGGEKVGGGEGGGYTSFLPEVKSPMIHGLWIPSGVDSLRCGRMSGSRTH